MTHYSVRPPLAQNGKWLVVRESVHDERDTEASARHLADRLNAQLQPADSHAPSPSLDGAAVDSAGPPCPLNGKACGCRAGGISRDICESAGGRP